VGLVYIEGIVKNQGKEEKVRFLVDSGAFYTVLKKEIWQRLGLKEISKSNFILADGTVIERGISETILELPPYGERHTPIVLGESEDENLLDKLTLIAASSPAVISELIDALEIAAMYMGIPQNIAKKAILSVFRGTAELAYIKELQSIRNSIITPKGITSRLMREFIEQNIKSSLLDTFIQASEELEKMIAKLRLEYKI
jgi:predicted aspartyl protease